MKSYQGPIRKSNWILKIRGVLPYVCDLHEVKVAITQIIF